MVTVTGTPSAWKSSSKNFSVRVLKPRMAWGCFPWASRALARHTGGAPRTTSDEEGPRPGLGQVIAVAQAGEQIQRFPGAIWAIWAVPCPTTL